MEKVNLEDQVCSLELARKLKLLGVMNPSIFGWMYSKHEPHIGWYVIRGTNDHKPMIWGGDDCKLQEQKDKEISAYTVAELGELLGSHAESSKGDNGWYMRTISPIQKWKDMFPCKTEADARAKMLIYLVEQGFIKL